MVVNNWRAFPIWSDILNEHLFYFSMVLAFALLYSFLVIWPMVLISLREYNWFIIDIILFSGENDRLCFWFLIHSEYFNLILYLCGWTFFTFVQLPKIFGFHWSVALGWWGKLYKNVIMMKSAILNLNIFNTPFSIWMMTNENS